MSGLFCALALLGGGCAEEAGVEGGEGPVEEAPANGENGDAGLY